MKYSKRTLNLLSIKARKRWGNPVFREKMLVAFKQRKTVYHHTEETKEKIRESNRRRFISEATKQKISQSLLGHKDSWEIRMKKSKGQIGKKRSHFYTPDVRRKMSLTRIRLMQEGKVHPEYNGISGNYYSRKNKRFVHHRSLLELNWFQLLEKMDNVKKYKVEPIKIPYYWKGATHYYLPDLLIFYKNGNIDLVEIKPESCMGELKNRAKFKAAKKWCCKRKKRTIFKVYGYNLLKEKRAHFRQGKVVEL